MIMSAVEKWNTLPADEWQCVQFVYFLIFFFSKFDHKNLKPKKYEREQNGMNERNDDNVIRKLQT